MATAAQKARIKKMNEVRAARRAEREAEKEAASVPVRDSKGGPKKGSAREAAERVRKLREQADKLEASGLSVDDDSPQATVARARAKRSPTVRRVEIARDPVTGRVMARGRDGKMISRRVTTGDDKFHIDKADIPEGWSYQWIAMEIKGEHQRNTLANFAMGGWEPVPMSRYPGRYGPASDGDKHIAMDGLGLYERPEELTEEARDEEIAAARNLIRTRNEQFAPKLPDARSQRLRGTGLQARRSIEGMPSDVGRPAYEIAVDDGLAP
jgi:hypothetical protein